MTPINCSSFTSSNLKVRVLDLFGLRAQGCAVAWGCPKWPSLADSASNLHSKAIQWLHVIPVYMVLVVHVVDDILKGISIVNVMPWVSMEDTIFALVKVFRPRLGSVFGQADAFLPDEIPEDSFKRKGERLVVVSLRSKLSLPIIVVLVRRILVVIRWVISSLGIVVRVLVVVAWRRWNPIVVRPILLLPILVAMVEVLLTLVLITDWVILAHQVWSLNTIIESVARWWMVRCLPRIFLGINDWRSDCLIAPMFHPQNPSI